MEIVDLNAADNQGIFDTYLGLTASGYDLANPDRAGAICEAVKAGNWSPQTLQYFRFARIDDGRINPYWPRGSMLTSVSLLTDQSPVTMDPALIRTHLATMGNLPPADVNAALISWAAALPEQAADLRNSRIYDDVWARYRRTIQDEIHANGIAYRREVLAAQGRLKSLLPSHSSLPQVITILNPLQADPLTDVVSVRGYVYVVTSHLRAESCNHEQIHILIDPILRAWGDRLSMNVDLLDPVYECMAHLRYAWDRSAASWNNVFSETLVRVLTVLVSEDGGSEWQASQIEKLVQQGFAYARPIAETIVMLGEGQPLSDEWLEQCLRACARPEEHTKK